jgi:hypothetical protein
MKYYTEKNEGFMEMSNDRRFRSPQKEVYVEIVEIPMDLSSDNIGRVKISDAIEEEVDYNQDRIRAKMTQSYRNPKKLLEINPATSEFLKEKFNYGGKVNQGLSFAETIRIAKQLVNVLGKDFSITKGTLEPASFDLDYKGVKYDGGSYLIMTNGDVVNVALPNRPAYYNYINKNVYKNNFEQGGFMNGAWINERKHVNHNEDYEKRYAKNKPNRSGYKGKRNFEDGGSLGSQYVLIKSIGNYGMGNVSFLVSKKELNKIPFDTIQEKAEAFVNNIEDSFGETSYRFNKLITNPKEISDYAKGYNHSNYKVVLSNDEENYPDGFYIIKSKNYLKFKDGGGISNFERLSRVVAKNYEGKRVKPQYQKEYGKTYSKEEAKEVGDKVAGKVKAMQSKKMFFGGFNKQTEKITMKGKDGMTKDGKAIKILSDDGNSVLAIELNKIGTGSKPMRINKSELDIYTFE